MSNFQALHKDQHKKLKINIDQTYAHSANSYAIPVSVFELSQAQADYPIVFIKDSKTGQFHLVALVGLKPNENLFSHPTGWQAEYIPQQLQGYPLALTPSSHNTDKQIVAIDIDSAAVNESDGEILFTDEGEQSEFLTHKIQVMSQVIAQMPATRKFIDQMVKNELISPQSLTVKTNQGKEVNVTGLYIINEEKINNASLEVFNTLKSEHLLVPIYACLFSLQRISRLIKLT